MQKNFAEAERLAAATLDGATRVLGPEHTETHVIMEKRARIYVAQQRWVEAESVYATLVDRAARTQHGFVRDFLRGYGHVLTRRRSRSRAAERRSAIRERPRVPAVTTLVELYEACNRPDEAAEWRAKLGASPSSQPGS